jgi:hypothetical protein
VEVDEAFIHRRKQIPRFGPDTRRRSRGDDDPVSKGGDYVDAHARYIGSFHAATGMTPASLLT